MLIANGVRLSTSNPMRQFGAASAGSVERAAWHQAGARRSSFTAFSALSGYPSGDRHPVSWCMAPKAGGLNARFQTDVTTSVGDATLAAGRNLEGSTSITFSVPDAQLQLIVSASGSTTITFSTSGLAAGVLAAAGSTTITFSIGTATLGAIVDAIGAANVTFSASAVIRAIGHLAGDITPFTELSPQSLAEAVWSAVAADNNVAGSMGEKLNDAGSASNPWTEVIESGFTAAEILRLIAAVIQGDATGLESGSPVFKGLNGTTDRVTATYSGGTRTVTDRDAT